MRHFHYFFYFKSFKSFHFAQNKYVLLLASQRQWKVSQQQAKKSEDKKKHSAVCYIKDKFNNSTNTC